MSTEKVHVLIRTKLPFWDYPLSKTRYRYFKECLSSVLYQSHKDISILILQDSPFAYYSGTKKENVPTLCSEMLNEWRALECAANKSREINFYIAKCNGPALALYYLRKELNGLYPNDNDIVILLDDDDFLYRENALADISKQIEKNDADVCLLSYVNTGDSSLDITNGAGSVHNRLVKALYTDAVKIDDLKDTDAKDETIYPSYASSLGWTKAYKYSVVLKYMNELIEFFGYDEGKLIDFYKKNNAYEDFPDIINICRKGTIVTACKEATHAYRKTPSSVTANPTLNDFREKRTAHLSLLLGLSKISPLSKAGENIIARYIILKIALIENILAKFRNEGYDHNRFRRHTYRGYFFELLIKRLKEDNQIEHLSSLLHSVAVYKDKLNIIHNPENAIRAAGEEEVSMGYIDIQQCIRENVILGEKPINKFRDRSLRVTIVSSAVAVASICILIWFASLENFKSHGDLLTVGWGVISVLIAYSVNSYLKYKSKKDDDERARVRYKNELKDLLRHLYANLNILIKIRRDLRINIIPSTVHFRNLMIPENSILLSDEQTNALMINELDTLSRVKFNIRNINNSAELLYKMADSGQYNGLEIRNAISWEIPRLVGNIIELKHVIDDPAFRFTKERKDLERYVKINDMLTSIAEKIKGEDDPKDLIQKEYDKYLTDRYTERKVLLNSK